MEFDPVFIYSSYPYFRLFEKYVRLVSVSSIHFLQKPYDVTLLFHILITYRIGLYLVYPDDIRSKR